MNCIFGRSNECTDKKWDGYLHINNFGKYEKTQVCRPNGRQDYQLLIISKGTGKFFIEGEEKILSVGNGVLYKPFEPQIYTFDEKSEYFWFHFSGAEASSILERTNLTSHLIKVRRLDIVNEIFKQMLNCTAIKKDTSEDLLCGLFLVLISKLDSDYDSVDSGILKVINHIKSESFYGPTTEEYAKMAGLSKYHFLRKFKKITGATPKAYKSEILTEKAKELIQNTDFNISEISDLLGFDDSLYFSRFFKKSVGISPNKYRNNFSR